jgi:hypothetical protein
VEFTVTVHVTGTRLLGSSRILVSVERPSPAARREPFTVLGTVVGPGREGRTSVTGSVTAHPGDTLILGDDTTLADGRPGGVVPCADPVNGTLGPCAPAGGPTPRAERVATFGCEIREGSLLRVRESWTVSEPAAVITQSCYYPVPG